MPVSAGLAVSAGLGKKRFVPTYRAGRPLRQVAGARRDYTVVDGRLPMRSQIEQRAAWAELDA
jgi:hypothetical protein